MKRLLLGVLILALLLSLLASGISCTKQGTEQGTQLIFRADLSQIGNESAASAMQGTISIIKRRLDAYGFSQATVQQQGSDQIVVKLPGVTDAATAMNLIGKTAQVEFKEKVYDSSGNTVSDSNGNPIWIPATAVNSSGQEVPLTGQYLKNNAKVVYDPMTNAPEVFYEFNSEGATLFSQITGRLLGKQLGIFLDNQLICSPMIMAQLGASGVISGISLNDAKTLAIQLNDGALPCPLRLLLLSPLPPSSTVAPTPPLTPTPAPPPCIPPCRPV
jgi:protein-export membrane protein SecD